MHKSAARVALAAIVLFAFQPVMAFEPPATPNEMARARSTLADLLKEQQLRGTLAPAAEIPEASQSASPVPSQALSAIEDAKGASGDKARASVTDPVRHEAPNATSAPSSRSTKSHKPDGTTVIRTHPSAVRRSGVSTDTSPRPLDAQPSVTFQLPAKLAPERADPSGEQRFLAFLPELGLITATASDLQRLEQPLRTTPGTPIGVISACRDAVVAAAQNYGLVSVDATSAGSVRRDRYGMSAPIEMKVIYSRVLGREGRQAHITCHLDPEGRVVGAS